MAPLAMDGVLPRRHLLPGSSCSTGKPPLRSCEAIGPIDSHCLVVATLTSA